MKLSYSSPAFLLLSISTLIAADGPLSPAESLKQFHTEPGLRIELVAAEPQVVDPVAMAFDEQGRLYVAEDRGYPVGPGEGKPPVGIIAMLEDRDGDGRYETRRDFATGLTYPNGVLPWRGGVFVTCAPDIYYLKDTDGDGKADIRQVVLTGFGTNSTTQLRVSHPTLGLDGWVYVTSGLVGGNVTSPLHPERPAVQFTKSDSRFNPDTYEFETGAGAGQFGLTMDDFGRKFVASNRNPLQQVMLQPYHLKRNPSFAFSETVQDVSPAGELAKVHPLSKDSTTASFMPSLMATPHAGTFTSACSPLIFRGIGLPEGYIGNVFVCEPAQNLVQRQVITPSGATFSARAIGEKVDFLATEDSWFRPVFAANGPDGALYICDMYRKTLDHPQYLPEHIRAKADFESGKDKGRIYRIVKKTAVSSSSSRRAPRYEDFSATALCELLSVPNGWLRDVARRSLTERKDGLLPDALRATVAKGRAPEARTAALHLLRRLRELDDTVLLMALKDTDARVRENAVQLSESRISGSPGIASQVLALAKDPDARVRFQVALALGEAPKLDIVPALALIGAAAGEDRWTRAAVLSSVGTRADELFAATMQQVKAGATVSEPMMESLGQVLGAGQPVEKLVGVLGGLEGPADAAWPATLMRGMAEGLRGRGIKGTESSPLLNLVAGETPAAVAAKQRVQTVMQQSLKQAVDSQLAVSRRQAAVSLLANASFGMAGQALISLIAPSQPSELQVAVVRSLSLMNDPEVGKVLFGRERWRAYSPAVREAVVAAAMSQSRLVPSLLDALEAGHVQPWALTPQRRTALQKSRDAKIAARAEALFKNAGGGDRMKVYEEFKPVAAMTGNGKNGHAVFTRICAACHKMNGEGAQVGPDLSGVRNQPAEALLLHILVPDAEIYPGFTSYEVETKSGETVSGLLAGETATSVTIRKALAQEETILRSNIASISASNLSLMPQELEKQMTRQELADLLAFLKGE